MAYGKIVADQIQHSSEGTVGTQYVVNGSAKHDVHINTSFTIQRSRNTSSVVDTGSASPSGPADWTVSFTSNMNDTHYNTIGTAETSASRVITAANSATSNYVVYSHVSDNPTGNTGVIGQTVVFGDLA